MFNCDHLFSKVTLMRQVCITITCNASKLRIKFPYLSEPTVQHRTEQFKKL